MKYSLGISNFPEEISSLSHSVVFFYFFALIPEEGFLISSCYSLELCIQIEYLSFSPLLFASLLFTAICKASLHSHFAFLHFFSILSWARMLIYPSFSLIYPKVSILSFKFPTLSPLMPFLSNNTLHKGLSSTYTAI